MNGMVGHERSVGKVVGLSIITLGIYSLVWQYRTFKEMKEYSGEGIGGALGLLVAVFVGFVNGFLLPSEVGKLYASKGRAKPVSGTTGCWIFLPILGNIIWVVKVQGALNAFWLAEAPAPVAVDSGLEYSPRHPVSSAL